MKLLKLTPAGACSVVEIEEFDLERQLDQMYQIIGCDTIEIVRLPRTTGCLIVDESGLLKKDPQLNPAATILAEQPIVGTVLLGSIRQTDDGDMIAGYQGTWMLGSDTSIFDVESEYPAAMSQDDRACNMPDNSFYGK